MLEDQLVTHLRNDVGVGAIAGDRIYAFGSAPQAPTQPYVTYQVVSNLRIGPTMTAGRSAFWRQTIQIDAWAPKDGNPGGQLTAINLARALRASLNGAALPGEDDVDSVEWDDWRDLPEDDWARRQSDFVFWVRDP